MDANPATIMDLIALGVVLLSSALALSRGFVREVLSVGSFIAAALATIFTVPVFRTVTMNWIESEIIATIITGAAVFLGVYILMTFATSKISRFVRQSPHIGILDRTAGFAFGAVRGMVLLAIALLGWNFLARPEQTPDWVAKARVYPAINATAHALKSLAPDTAPVRKINVADNPDPAPASASVNRNKRTSADEKVESGYDQTDRLNLDQVITTKIEGDAADKETVTEQESPQ